ncbi:MAG: SGNH/GDSL hydrolase family protein [Woeseiaceae bacterium]
MFPDFRKFFAVVTSGFALSAGADSLLVVGEIPVSSGDATTLSQLQQLGHAVTVVKDSASTAASANGKDLVIISESVAPGKVSNKFNQVSVPVIVYEPWLYDNLGLTGAVARTDYGRAQNQTKLRMTGTHPLTGGLSGIVTVGSAASAFSWGKPGAAAVVAATLRNNTARPTIFAYEAGALLANGTTAPARRVAVHPNTGTFEAWNVNGQKLFSAAVQWARTDPLVAVTRILPLGDSITRGKTSHWSYRRNMEAALAGANCSFDLVGSQYGPASGPGSALLDRDHEGHSGFRTDEILAGLSKWLPANEPDWALIHIGTNDVLQSTSIAAARINISSMIDKLRDANPNVGILLAQVIPNRPENEAAVVALNDAIAALAAEKDMPSVSPVIVVDHYSGYSTFTHNYDQIHPNDLGEAMMAERWFQALLPRIADFCGP